MTYRSGFLILGYEDNLEIQWFTAFILDKTNLIQQTYLPKFFIPTDVFPVVFKNFKDYKADSVLKPYYFNLLPNNILISGLGHSDHDLWSADLTSLLIKDDNIMLNVKSDLPATKYEDEKIVTLTIIESVFNVPGVTYSLEIDEQFFRYRTGINGSVFPNRSFIHYDTVTEEYEFAEDGTNLFEKSDDKSLFLKNLTEGLAENISQIKINNYEMDKSINKIQLLLSLLINPPVDKVNNINVEQIKESLDIMIKNLEEIPLSLNNYTKYLDSSYGCALKNDLWDRYKYILIGIVCASTILIALFLLARKKCKEGNNLIIFKLALLSSDMVSDFLFAIDNSSNVENLRIPSIVFLVIPMVTNLILVFHIFITECMDNKKYIVWFKENSQPAAIVTILCGGDIAVLNLLSSNLAGFELFNAPLSKRAEKIIYYGTVLNTFLEDVPQLIIQIIYQYKTISYDVIPLISLTTGSIILLSTILGHTYNIIIRIYTKLKVSDQNNELLKNSLEECNECGEHTICKHIAICEKCNLLK
ncbi:hypothetical protein C1645_817031 [Glomus cerebriforme]|uniref:Uncharacterized protein n=1 Tax=Glomus cerebriforme TaxID=658196 RepID=A0A397TFE4_9GLOM|nr:hypothetical protein C1645_817031 [Glomus cerebriforme]